MSRLTTRSVKQRPPRPGRNAACRAWLHPVRVWRNPAVARAVRYATWGTLAAIVLVSDMRPARVVGQQPNPAGSAAPVDLGQLSPETRLREGSRLTAQRGYFRLAGDRVAFHTVEGSRRFITLENLNLERIVNQITATGEESLWSVSGEITEFRGLNYLLVTHAVLKSDATATPTPSATP